MRVPNWKSRLSAELMAAKKRVWKWSEHDCVMLGARCAEMVTGEPYIERLKISYVYETAQSAGKYLRDLNLKELITAELGETVNWVNCGHGDLVLCAYDDPEKIFSQQLTVHDGAQLLAPSSIGIKRVPFERALCGWRL